MMTAERMSATISMQGTLDKQCKMRTWNWKKYWFVLKDNHLNYFKEDSRRSSSGLLDLSSAHSVKVTTKGPPNGFPFEIITKGRTHVFSAISEENRTKWIDHLQRAMLFKRSTSSVSSSTSSVSSMNLHKKSFSTPSCDSISDEEQMIYENEDEAGNTDDVFIQNSPKSPKSFDRAPPAIPSDPEPEDPLYSTADDIEQSRQSANFSSAAGNDYAYVSTPAVSNGDNKKENGEDSDYAYSEVPAKSPQQKVQMRKSALRRLAGSNTIITESTVSADPGYDQVVTTAPRTPSDYKSEPIQLSPLTSDTDTSGSSDGYDRTSNATIVANQAEGAETLPSDLHFEPIPDLPHPRLELTFGGAFDDIRRFIANNRGPSEMYAMPNKNNNNGDAVRKLKAFLNSMESQSAV